VAVLFAQPLPVLPVQALWINMTTAVLLGLTLAFEPKEPGLMDRPPRPPGSPILDAVLLQRILLVGLMLLAGAFGLFEWALYHGASVEQARTVAVNVFAVGQAFYLLNCRSLRWSMFRIGVFSNPWVWGGIAAMGAVQLAFTYMPVMNRMFHTAPIPGGYWLAILGVGLVIYTVMGLEKLVRPRRAQASPQTGAAR
jgi:magnesium-transporting ATPase (P-type)